MQDRATVLASLAGHAGLASLELGLASLAGRKGLFSQAVRQLNTNASQMVGLTTRSESAPSGARFGLTDGDEIVEGNKRESAIYIRIYC